MGADHLWLGPAFVIFILIGLIALVCIAILSREKRKVKIISIIIGELQRDAVIIQNNSRWPIKMTGWSLWNDAAVKFKFPAFVLRGKQRLKLWTALRDKKILELEPNIQHLFWARKQSIWSRGEVAYLEDAKGAAISTYLYP